MTTTKNLKISAVIAAAGAGKRAGLGMNKLLAPLYGEPAIRHTFKKFDIPAIDEVIVAASEDSLAEISAIAAPFGYKVITGGKTRTESVKMALNHVTGDIVLIHDGARPFLSAELIEKCIDSVVRFGSAVCALPVTDTVAGASYGLITSVPERSSLYSLQTPQAFFTEDIRRAYSNLKDEEYTDDSSVYREFIGFPRIVAGEKENIKLTYAEDFKREFLKSAPADGCRVGFGVDVHAFCDGDHVTLAGVRIPSDRALAAHSDGDVVFHAVTDALLSAAGLKDIGHYFPADDPEWENADSAHMCAIALGEVKKAGYAPVNVSVSVQAEKPRLAPYIDKMASTLAQVLGIPHECAGISAGTAERLGFVGEGLGITAYAYILLKEI